MDDTACAVALEISTVEKISRDGGTTTDARNSNAGKKASRGGMSIDLLAAEGKERRTVRTKALAGAHLSCPLNIALSLARLSAARPRGKVATPRVSGPVQVETHK